MPRNKNIEIVTHSDEKNIVNIYIKYDGSNYDFLSKKKYTNIHFDKTLFEITEDNTNFIQMETGNYYCVKFNVPSGLDFLEMAKSFEKILIDKKTNENKKYAETLKSIIEFFNTVSSSSTVEKLRGDFGEALFVLKCLKLNLVQNISNCLQKKEDTDNFDFVFENNQLIEIKTTTKLKSEINLKIRQIIENDNCNIVVIKVDNYEKTKIDSNYVNIIDVYNEIEKITPLNSLFSQKREEYKNNKELVESNFINMSNVTMHFFKKEHLPKIEKIKNDKAIKNIILVLDALLTIDDYKCFDEKIISIAKK